MTISPADAMKAPALRSRRFREEREADWLALERLLGRLERRGAAPLSDDDLLAIPVLYRAALSSLSLARAISLDRALLAYLESLCARAYFVVYGVRGRLIGVKAKLAHSFNEGTGS